MSDDEGTFVLPGDPIDPSLIPTHPKKPLRLGPGLRHLPPDQIIPTAPGRLYSDKKKNSIWVEYNGGRYTPTPSDTVIGQISHSTGDTYHVNLSPQTPLALLPHLAFEGATKKNRPALEGTMLVYARVALANKYMDVELECINPSTHKADGLGQLSGGMLFPVSLGLARRLLLPKNSRQGRAGGEEDEGGAGGVVVLDMFGEAGVEFEAVVGRNGRVWVGEGKLRDVVMIGRALTETDERDLGVEGQKALVKRLLQARK